MTGVPGTVGRPGWTLPRAPGRPRAEHAGFVLPELALQAIPFFLMGLLAAAHCAALVEPHRTARALLVVLVTTTGGMLLASTARLPRAPGIAVRVLLLLAMAVLSVGAIGIRFKLLWPTHWGTLGDRISGGLSSIGAVTQWPYAGPNTWIKLTTLLGAPLVLVVASAFVFWPRAKENRAAYRGFALVLLVALYGVAVAARPFESQTLRGIALLVCLAAWLWLPRLSGRDAVGAVVAIGIAAVAGLALAPRVASTEPWVDYSQWSWALRSGRTVAFDWQHQYGPLNWPRKGTTMLLVKSKNPHYWKAENLDRFDGRGWTTGNASPRANGRISDNPKWTEKVHVTVRGLKSDLVVAPGSLLDVSGTPGEATRTSYGTALTAGVLKAGDSYDATSYTPDPTVKQMRAAPAPEAFFSNFTLIQLPTDNGFLSTYTWMPLRGQPDSGDPGAIQALERSRYARIYKLAQRVAAGAKTDYDVVKKIGTYLESKYTYSEKVSIDRYPLERFLLKDKRGYCQQFSGSAALMLRMLGIPTRVAAGFAPGTFDKDTKEYVVRDLDAHSWIEVWFQGIGWVPFDPTPAAAPAASQSTAFQPFSEVASAARGDTKDKLGNPKLRAEILAAGKGGTAGLGGGGEEKSTTPWGWMMLGTVLGALIAAAVLVSLLRLRWRRHPRPADCGDAEVDHLIRLLCRLGIDIKPGTTLLEVEERVGRLGGPEAARYTQRLRERRYGLVQRESANRQDRRRIRRLLAAGVGAGPVARLHLALPDYLGTPRFRR